MGNMSSPTRAGASASAAIPPAGASTGRPACSARCSVGASSGSTPTTRVSPRYHAAIPPISPPPPTATSTVSRSGACSESSAAERALAEESFALVECVHREGARALAPALRRGEGVRVALAHDLEVRSGRADARDLRGRGDLGHEDLRRHAQAHGRVRDGRAVIAAGSGHDSRFRDLAPQKVRECASRLEGAGVLELLELQSQGKGRRASEAELRSVRAEGWA